MKINLNADIGEGYGKWKMGDDESLLKVINSANIACGKHAGDENIMRNIISFCIKQNVSIGAHPGFSDIEGFGRRRINLSSKEVENLIAYQTGSLIGISHLEGGEVSHIKPHGALNNMACEDYDLACAIINGFIAINKNLILLAPVKSQLEKAGINLGVNTICEGFADRTYMSDGSLSPRSMKNSVKFDLKDTIDQAIALANGDYILTIEGEKIKLKVDSICIHGDKKEALDQSNLIRKSLLKNNFQLVSLPNLG